MIADDEQAVSELIGEIMLIGIVILTFGIIAASVYSYIDKSPDMPHIDIAGKYDDNHVYLKHQGGDTVDEANLRILVDVNGNTTTFDALNGKWTLGSVMPLNIGNTTQNDTVRVAIVHVPSGRILASGDVQEGIFGAALTNIAPTADAGCDQENDLCNDTGWVTLSFDGSGSYDPDGSIVRWDWDFGDGNVSEGESVSHTYSSSDTYAVTLVVTDDVGATASDTCTVTIDSAAPLSANAGPDQWVALGDSIELNGSESTGCIKSWYWDMGDGNTGSSEIVTHIYNTTGSYRAMLNITSYSDEEDDDFAIIEVLNDTIRITAPENGTIVSGTVEIDARVFGIPASDINRVKFFSGTKPIGTDYSGETIANSTLLYSLLWNTTDWTACSDAYEGVRKIHAVVYYSSNTSMSQYVTIEVDNDAPPVVTITAPETGEYVNNTTSIQAIVTDDKRVANVTFYMNGAFRGIMAPPNPFDQDWGYRVPITIYANGSNWNDTPVNHTINFTEKLSSINGSGIIDTNSVRVIERYEHGTFMREVQSRVDWNESGYTPVQVPNGGFEVDEDWNYTENRSEWNGSYGNTMSHTGSSSYLIEYPWDQPSSAGDYAKVTQRINRSKITENSHVLRFWVRDNYNGNTSGYHFKQVLVDDTVLWEEDVAGDEGGWVSADVNISDYIGQDVNLTLRVYDKAGVSSFGVKVWWDDVAILTNTTGDVAWIINGTLSAGSERYYAVYFDTLENGRKGDPGYPWFNSTASEYPSVTDGGAEVAYPYYTYQWNTTAEHEGVTSIAVDATDDACPVNQTNESSIVVYVDNVPDPVIEIASPDIYDTVAGTVNVTTDIHPEVDDVTDVEFYVKPEIVNGEWVYIGNDTTVPFTHLWDTTYWQAGYGGWDWVSGGAGKYYLRAHLEDRYNQSADSDPNFYVWVKNPAPAVNITTPANGSTVEGSVNITADVTDNGYVVLPVTYEITNETGVIVASGEMTCDWWDASWSRRKPITITSSADILNYQINLTIDYESEMQSDFDDLRFFDESGSELPYWIENKTDGVNATVWVNVSSINAGNTTIFMYYGNAAAASKSDGDATFDFFDDFEGTVLDTSEWSATGSYSVDDSIRINTGSVYTNSIIATTPENRTFEMRACYHTHSNSYSGIMIADVQGTAGSNHNGDAVSYLMTASNSNPYTQMWGANGTVTNYNIVSGTTLYDNVILDTGYIIGFSFTGSHISYFLQNLAYTDIARSDCAGTWDRPFYLWLGYFTGSNASTTDIDDVTVEWVRVRRYATSIPTATVGSEERGGRVVCHTIWDTTSLSAGNYTICISAEDNANQTGMNCTTIYLYNPPPAIDIISPANNSTVEGTVGVVAEVTDDGYVVPPVTYSVTNESNTVVGTGNMSLWSRRKPITITSSTDILNYQIDLHVDYESEMQSDFGDIRFFDESGSELPYWIENMTDGVNATVWVNVSSINAGNTTIFMYYGNAIVDSDSDVDGTFTKDFGESGLVGHWHFDEGSGDSTLDSSGHSNDGTLTNGAGWAGADGGEWDSRSDVNFSTGDSLVFDGNDDYIDCGDNFTSITTEITAEFWMKSDDTSNHGTPISYATTHHHNEFLIYNYRNFSIYIGGSHIDTGISANDGHWHHIVVTWRSSDGSTKFYKDGTSVYSKKRKKGYSINHGKAQDLVIGSEQDSVGGDFDPSQAFLGTIDEVRIYNRVLGEDEIYRHYIRSRYASNPPTVITGSEESGNFYIALWNTTSLSIGNYTITVSAEDNAGQANTSSALVHVAPP